MYSCGRVTPIWSTADAAKQCAERPRTESLARHKMPHMSFTGAREIETIIPRPALSAKASERLESLAVPKRRPDGPFRDALWPVSQLCEIQANLLDTDVCNPNFRLYRTDCMV